MTDHKLTDEEVIKAFECCVEGTSETCRKCVFGLNPPYPVCKTMVEKYALDLINRQKAEIERLEDDSKFLQDRRFKEWRAVRDEVVNEFAERLCEGRVSNDPVVIAEGCLLKELTEEKK